MIDDFAKQHLHDHLRWVREALVWKLDGLGEYDIRRPVVRLCRTIASIVLANTGDLKAARRACVDGMAGAARRQT
jgi:hypothetical protein